MQTFLVLLGFYLFAVLVVLPIWMIVKIIGHRRDQEILQQQLTLLQKEIQVLRAEQKHPPAATAAPAPVIVQAVTPASTPPIPAPLPVPAKPAAVTPAPVVVATPPPPAPLPVAEPPMLPPVLTPPRPVYVPSAPSKPVINWEQFMGAKLFAWIGGLALFLGVAFFVKYSFEHIKIPPEVRMAGGFVFGLGLIVGGLKIPRARYAITALTLIGAGVVSLYAVTFACNSIYHFEYFGPIPTFLLMTLITATAFVLAVRLDAPVVAILGILGGFLTPVLINTGHDNPPGLFGYIALLDVGLIAVTLHRRWFYLVPLGAAGTVLMMISWAGKFYAPEKTTTAMVVCLGFCGLFIEANEMARKLGRHHRLLSWSAAALPLVAFGFAFGLLNYPTVAARAGHFLGFVLLVDVAVLILVWRDATLPRIHLVSGLIAFLLLAFWTGGQLTDALLPWALTAYLLFAALHTVFPLLLERHRPASSPSWWSQLFPPLTLLLMLLPIFKLDTVSLLLWPAILLVDVLAIAIAVLSASLLATAAVLVLTLLATGACIFRVPSGIAFDSSLLLVIGGFAVFFFAASIWLVRRLGAKLPAADRQMASVFGDARAQLPAFASLLPFLLLIMVCLRLDVPNPSAVFGLGLLLVVLTLGLARMLVIEWLPACALVGMAALEYAWHSRFLGAVEMSLPLAWYVAFYAIFAIYPFLFRSTFRPLTGPWAVAALSGLAHFWMIYQAAMPEWPADFLGAIPALFTLAPLGSLVLILRTDPAGNPARLNQLAWFGGLTLFFITLIFPIQFERQWLTVAWALEGAALLWLFHRVPHPGLRATGAVLLVVAFGRLAFNSAVFSYQVSGTTLFNWYLYAYGLAIAALFFSAKLTAPPRERIFGVNAPPVFNALGVILAFILLNIEIADYFTPTGAHTLAFKFSGNMARDMAYTIGWALFALGLVIAGIWKHHRVPRYAGIVLLSIALLKLLLHDLARLDALYRVGALMIVAVIAILASVAYQRYLPSNEKPPRA